MKLAGRSNPLIQSAHLVEGIASVPQPTVHALRPFNDALICAATENNKPKTTPRFVI
jgi:hypothetical protein